MPRPDEGLIHAWLDGELSPEESERVARLVAEDAEWGEAAAEARGLVAASSRILSALDAVPGGVIPKGSRAAPAVAKASRFSVRPWMRIAAGLVLVAGTAAVLTRDETSTLMQGEPFVTYERADTSPASAVEESQRSDRRQASGQATGQGADASTSPVPGDAPAATRPAPVPAPVRGAVANAAATQRFSDVAVTGMSTAQKAELPRVPAVASQGTVQGAVQGANQVAIQSVTPSATLGAAGAAAAPPPAVASELADASARERAAQERAAADRASTDRAAQQRAASERTAVAATELDRAATPRVAEPRAAELRSRAAVSARSEAGIAAKALSVRALEGCWRTTTAAGGDTVLVTPTILRTVGDSVVIAAGSEVRPATVVQDGDVLRGETTNATGARVPFRATRATCPSRPEQEATHDAR